LPDCGREFKRFWRSWLDNLEGINGRTKMAGEVSCRG
jgi:hypothetical protein